MKDAAALTIAVLILSTPFWPWERILPWYKGETLSKKEYEKILNSWLVKHRGPYDWAVEQEYWKAWEATDPLPIYSTKEAPRFAEESPQGDSAASADESPQGTLCSWVPGHAEGYEWVQGHMEPIQAALDQWADDGGPA